MPKVQQYYYRVRRNICEFNKNVTSKNLLLVRLV